MIFIQKEKKRGLAVSAVSLLYFLFIVDVVMPFFAVGRKLEIVDQRYSYIGTDVVDIIRNIVFHPWTLLVNIITPNKISYIVALLLPVMFLPILSLGVLALSLPSLLINLLSSNSIAHTPFQYYHTAPVLAFIFLAATMSLGRLYLKKERKVIFNAALQVLIVMSIVFSVFLSPAPYSLFSSLEEFRVSEHAHKLARVKRLIPQNASLSVQNNLGAHFSQREHIHTFPYESHGVDFVLLDIHDPYVVTRTIPRVRSFVFMNQMHPQQYYDAVVAVFEDDNYGVAYYSDDGYLIFKRGQKRGRNNDAYEMFNGNIKEIYGKYHAEVFPFTIEYRDGV